MRYRIDQLGWGGKYAAGGSKMLYVLNVPVLTDWGKYDFAPISREEAKEKVASSQFISAVGHQATAEILTAMLGVEIPFNRTAVRMQKGDEAIVFRLLQRLPEGVVLSREELEALPYELGLLRRVG